MTHYIKKSILAEKTPDTEDYEYDNVGGDADVKASNDVPEFISTNETFEAVLGKPLHIGCQVNKLDVTQVWVEN